MAKISKFIKVDKNVLLEYIYDGENLISEGYNVLVNSRERKRSYLAIDTSGTYNTKANSLFRLDAVSNKYGKVNPSFYTFLEIQNFSAGQPIRHDMIKVHLPVNWTFGEYLGFYLRAYTYDSTSTLQIELSNFYFDMSDVSQQYLLNYTSPPLLFQEKLWGKNIQIEIPATSDISSQLQDNRPRLNSINANLSNGVGVSLSSPVFLEFRFIKTIQTINGVSSYLLATPLTSTIPQTPEFESLGLMIENSPNGDFFEIYGTYNQTINGFKKFIEDSVSLGNRYYVQYNITTYEQNVRGKTTTITVTDNFNETIEYRPIIKFSTTTAIIDVEMRLIDLVDEGYVIRRASYGMLQDEVAKYSLSMMKINMGNVSSVSVGAGGSGLSRTAITGLNQVNGGLNNNNNVNGVVDPLRGLNNGFNRGKTNIPTVWKPKIYNIKNSIDPNMVGLANSFGQIAIDRMKKRPVLRVNPLPNDAGGILNGNGLIPTGFNTGGFGGGLNAAGSGAGAGTGLGVGVGSGVGGAGSLGASGVVIEQVKVPFPVLVDRFNIIGRSENAVIDTVSFYGFGKIQVILYPFDNIIKFTIAQGTNEQPKFLDLTSFTEIKFVLRNDQTSLDFNLYTESKEVNLGNGQVIFKIPQAKFQEAKKIYQSNINVFYITGKNQNTTSVIYTGLFKIYDDKASVAELNIQAGNIKPAIKLDPNNPKEKAIVTRKQVDQPPVIKPNTIKDLQNQLGNNLNLGNKGNAAGGNA